LIRGVINVEGRSRYLYNNIGIFIITSIYGYNLYINNFMNSQIKIKKLGAAQVKKATT